MHALRFFYMMGRLTCMRPASLPGTSRTMTQALSLDLRHPAAITPSAAPETLLETRGCGAGVDRISAGPSHSIRLGETGLKPSVTFLASDLHLPSQKMPLHGRFLQAIACRSASRNPETRDLTVSGGALSRIRCIARNRRGTPSRSSGAGRRSGSNGSKRCKLFGNGDQIWGWRCP